MSGSFIAFFLLALVAIMGGVIMLTVQRVSHMIVSLVFTFLAIAGVYVTLAAEFVAVVQVLIYSGAITILMLFGIMLTKHDDKQTMHLSLKKRLFTLAGVAGVGVILYMAVKDLSFAEQATDFHVKNTEQIGVKLFSEYVIPFELTSVLLLVALIGAVILSKKDDDEEEEGGKNE